MLLCSNELFVVGSATAVRGADGFSQPSSANKSPASFDHLVGASEQRRRNGKAERHGGLENDHKLEFSGLHHWQVSGLGTLEDAAGVDAELAIHLCQVRSMAHQAIGFGKLAYIVD